MINTQEKTTLQLERITPEKAQKIFDSRMPNRNIRMRRVRELAMAMKENRFKDSLLRFYKGRLEDGQHRILACIASGCTIDAWIDDHDDPDKFTTYDIGAKRTNGDVLGTEGYKNCNVLSPTLILLNQVKKFGKLRDGVLNHVTEAIPTYKITEVAKKYPNLPYSVSVVHSVQKYQKVIPMPAFGVFHYLLVEKLSSCLETEKAQDIANEFVSNKIYKGFNLTQDDPVYTLRRLLDKIREQKEKNKGCIMTSPRKLLYAAITTWNKSVTNKRLKQLKIPEGDTLPNIFSY